MIIGALAITAWLPLAVEEIKRIPDMRRYCRKSALVLSLLLRIRERVQVARGLQLYKSLVEMQCFQGRGVGGGEALWGGDLRRLVCSRKGVVEKVMLSLLIA